MAALLAGVMTYFFSKRMRLSRAQHATTGIVAAVNDMPSGATLTAKDVELVDWPTNLPLAGSFDKIEDVVGKPLLYPLVASEPILKRDLGVEGSGIGISGKIPTGMRATAVKSNEIVGVAGFLYPGSRVDVMVTYTPPGGGFWSGDPDGSAECRGLDRRPDHRTRSAGQTRDCQCGDVTGQPRGLAKAATGKFARSGSVCAAQRRRSEESLIFVPRDLDQLASDKPRASACARQESAQESSRDQTGLRSGNHPGH